MDDKTNKLMKAVQNSDVKAVERLIKEGANAAYEDYQQGSWGEYSRISIIHHALRAEKFNLEIVKLLLEAGASVNSKWEDKSWTGSHDQETAFEMALNMSLRDKNAELLELFLKHGGDPNVKGERFAHSMRYDGKEEWYPIHTAARSGDVGCVKVLLAAGAKVDAEATDEGQSEYGDRNDTVETALHIAVTEKNVEIAELLIEAGADVNKTKTWLEPIKLDVRSPVTDPRDKRFIPSVRMEKAEATPLHLALRLKDLAMVSMLVRHGADLTIPYIRGDEELSVWDLATEKTKDGLRVRWSPKTHHQQVKSIRDGIKTILLVALRQNWKFPKEVLHLIIGHYVNASFDEEWKKRSDERKEKRKNVKKRLLQKNEEFVKARTKKTTVEKQTSNTKKTTETKKKTTDTKQATDAKKTTDTKKTADTKKP